MADWQRPPAPLNRRAVVVGVERQFIHGASGPTVPVLNGRLNVTYVGGQGGAPFASPRIGSTVSGLHSLPPRNGHQLVLSEGFGAGVPVGSITINDGLTPLLSHPALDDGETAILHPDGSVLSYAQNGPVKTLYRNGDGSVALTVNTTTGRFDLTAPAGFYVNGARVGS